MAGVPQPESLRQRIADLLAQVEPLLEELEQAEHIAATSPGHHSRPQLRLIKGAGAVIAVPLLWARDHTAQAAVAVLIGAVSGGSGLVAGSMMAPAPAGAEARQQPYQSQPYEGIEEFQAPRPATRVPSSSGSTQGAVPSPTATTPLPTGTPGPAPAQHDAMPNPTPLQGAASPLEPEPGLAPPTSTATPTVTPTPTPTPNPGLARKAAVLECVGEPGGEPPEDLVACVDALLGG